jgi:hypothetical protein
MITEPASNNVALYANVGADLTHYDVDVAGAALIKRETVTLPAAVQYAWPHASRRYLDVATSSSASGYGAAGTEHHVTAFSIDPASALTPHGAPIRLPTRPIHMCTDIPSENILVAFNNRRVHVYPHQDFTPGEEQPSAIDAGIFAHQVRVTPDNRPRSGDPRERRHPTKVEDRRAESSNQERRADECCPSRPMEGRVRPAALFSSDQALDVRVDQTQRDVHVSDEEAGSNRILRTAPRRWRAEQHQGASGGRHGPRTPRFVYGANRAQATLDFRVSKYSKVAKTASRCTGQSINRRATPISTLKRKDPPYLSH